MTEFLMQKRKAFSGITHVLIAICLFFIMWLLPLDISLNFVNSIMTNPVFAVCIFFVVAGGSLLPDLDNLKKDGGSTAVYQLGVLGSIFSMVMVTTSGIVWSIFHTKRDQKPDIQHRMFWHVPLIALIIFLLVFFFVPATPATVIDSISSGSNILTYLPQFFVIFFASISVYLGMNILIYPIFKMFGKGRSTQFVCLAGMALSIAGMITLPSEQLRLVGFAIALGYIFHILGDLITKGSVALLFPIPIRGQMWWKPRLPFQVETGGILNTILNFVFLAIDLFLAYFLFIAKWVTF